ncbi:hypothetical protein [Elizabethkingia meningoseptica]|uniref:hypothetical protein n=1 Tax=Elizabethkingia meningoseptica TaxID=238 RepID=UPI00293CCF13|nr:hypothetical protein [Elizabethkingia anophelis]MDV3474579.1 hypothetical protein [Elizabethkingia anophelis]
MRRILTTEIDKEKCNAAAFGLFNASVSADEGNKRGILKYGEVGFAVYDNNEQVTKALFGDLETKNGYQKAKKTVEFYKKFKIGGENARYRIAKAKSRYGKEK